MALKKIDLSGGYGGNNDSVNRVPLMTSNTTPKGEASDSAGSTDAWKAFDRTFSNYSLPGNSGWVQYRFEVATPITSYKIAGVSTSSYNPKNWELLGSNDGINWNVLDTRTNQTLSAVLSEFGITSPGSYTHYKLNIINNGGASVTYVNEFHLCTASDGYTKYTYTAPNGVTATSSQLTAASSGNMLYYMEYLFNNTIPSAAGATTQYWMSDVKTSVSIVFDFGAIGSPTIRFIRVAPKSDTNNSCNYKISRSSDSVNWTEIVPLQNYSTSTPFGTVASHVVNVSDRYIMIEVTSANASYNTALAEIEFYADNGLGEGPFYVSEQRGNDNNSGTNPAEPWKTITKAINSIGFSVDNDMYLYVGPGTYRESISMVDGYDKSLIIVGDPECLYVIGDNPGIVRLSSFKEDEQTIIDGSPQYLIQPNGKLVEFRNFYFTHAGSNYVTTSGVYRNCKAYSRLGINGSTCYNCVSFGKSNSYYACTCYGCIGIASGSAFALSTCYNCLGLGTHGFQGDSTTYCYNCIALFCTTGYSSGRVYNSYAQSCTTAFSSLISYSGNKSIASGGTTGGTAGAYATFDINITNWLSTGLKDKGTDAITGMPDKDIDNLDRFSGNGVIDIGPVENTGYTLEWDDAYQIPPGIKISREGQIKFTFKVSAGQYVAKRVFVKHMSTDPNLRPQLILRGQGIERVATAMHNAGEWEQLTVGVIPISDGTMDLIIYARDPNEYAYSVFSDPI